MVMKRPAIICLQWVRFKSKVSEIKVLETKRLRPKTTVSSLEIHLPDSGAHCSVVVPHCNCPLFPPPGKLSCLPGEKEVFPFPHSNAASYTEGIPWHRRQTCFCVRCKHSTWLSKWITRRLYDILHQHPKIKLISGRWKHVTASSEHECSLHRN